MQNIKKIVSIYLRKIAYSFLPLVPKENKLVLFTAWFGEKYIDNPKYVYEYLLMNTDYKALWLTRSETIYKQLKEEGKPVVKFNSILGVWKQIRAQAVFTTVQLAEFNSLLLTNVIHIDLGHGHPIKDPGTKNWDPYVFQVEKKYLIRNHFYAICASQFSADKLEEILPTIDKTHVFISDFARNDVFVDSALREGKNPIIEKYKQDGKKAIVYMPTHRSDGRGHMCMSEILPLGAIQNMCEKYEYVFVIKKHFYHRNEVEDLSMYDRIFDVTNMDDIDPQVLLYQTDILISDYSACYIDYLLLDRPMLFFQYDIEDFQKNERSLYIPFSKLDIAPIAYTKSDFVTELETLMRGEDDLYSDNRNSFTPTYFANTGQHNGREKVKKILDSLMNKYYC